MVEKLRAEILSASSLRLSSHKETTSHLCFRKFFSPNVFRRRVSVFVDFSPSLDLRLGNFRSEYDYDYEYEFSVLSTRTSKNVDLET